MSEVTNQKDVITKSDIEWWCLQDPGTSSVWAQLFLAYRPATASVYCLRENYITTGKQATLSNMYKLELQAMQDLHPNVTDWRNIYDEQAAWFYNERSSLDILNNLEPTHKNKWRSAWAKDLKPGINVIKDMLKYDRLVISDACPMLMSEIRGYKQAYVKRKSNDHLLDCLRYFILTAGYTVPEHVIGAIDAEYAKVSKLQKAQMAVKEFDFDKHFEFEMNGLFMETALRRMN